MMNSEDEENTENDENEHGDDFETQGENDEGDRLQSATRGRAEPIDGFTGVFSVDIGKVEVSRLENNTPR